MSHDWEKFWSSYRNREARTEEDLFVQVGKTVHGRPIPREAMLRSVDRIVSQLELSRQSRLLEFCCGNGLISFEVAPHVAQITAMDFAGHLIAAARRFKSRPNIRYLEGDAAGPLPKFSGEYGFPDRFLMNDSLAYFEPIGLGRILDNLLGHLQARPFLFFITGIPNFDLRWNFYDTEQRRARYLENERKCDRANDGMGRWWRPAEIADVCKARGLVAMIDNQAPELSNYRMDALIRGTG